MEKAEQRNMQRAGLIPSRSPRGTALIVSMSIIILLAGLGMMMLNEMRTRAHRTEVDSEDVKAFEAAEAGLDAAIRGINTGRTGCLGVGISWTADINANGVWDPNELAVAAGGWGGFINPDTNDGVVYSGTGYIPPIVRAVRNKFFEMGAPGTPLPFPRPEASEFDFYQHAIIFGDVRYFTWAIPWRSDGVDNDGNGLEDAADPSEENWFTIYSTGFSNPTTPQGKFTTVEATAQRLETSAKFNLDAALEIQIAPFGGP